MRSTDEAEISLLRALAIDEVVSGPEHTDVGWDLHLLANIARDQGLHSKAEGLYLRSFIILDSVLGPEHPEVAEARQRI